MPAIFQPQIAKKINKAPSVWVIVICSGHRLLWRDSYKDVDPALTSDESILHNIITIFIIMEIILCRIDSSDVKYTINTFIRVPPQKPMVSVDNYYRD